MKHVSAFNTLRVIDLLYSRHAYYILCVCVFLKNNVKARVHNSWLRFSAVETLVPGNVPAVDACKHAHTHTHTHQVLS